MASLTRVSDAAFQREVLDASGPVMVDFFAQWCGPCKAIRPVLEELASEFQGTLKIVAVDIEEAPVAARTFAVRSVPTFMIFAGGKVVATKIGTTAKANIASWINNSI